VDRFEAPLVVTRALPGDPVTTLQSTTMAADAATQIHLAADSEGGGAWISPAGDALHYTTGGAFADKMEGPADWQIGGSTPIGIVTTRSVFSSQVVINEAHYARRGGTEQIAAVPAKKRRTHTRLDLENETDEQVLALASAVVTVASVQRQRLVSCTIQPVPGTPAGEMSRRAKIGDKVEVAVDTIFGWSYSTVTQIFGIKHEVDDEQAFVSYRLDDTVFDGEFAAFSDGFSDGFS
jgi:hypothetical protein